MRGRIFYYIWDCMMIKMVNRFFATEFGAACKNQLQFFPRAVLLFVFIFLSYLYIKEHRHEIGAIIRHYTKKGWLLAFFLYLSYMLITTIFARSITNPLQFVFENVGLSNNDEWNAEIYKNIYFFVPYVFLYIQALKPSKPIKSAITISVVTSLFIEITQLLFWLGSFQFADILHNIIGGMLGYGLWRVVNTLKTKYLISHIWKWIGKKQ